MAHCCAHIAYPKLSEAPVGKQIRNIYQDRILQFIQDDGQFTHLNLPAKYYNAIVEGDQHIKISAWSAPGQTRPTFKEATSPQYRPVKLGDKFGPSWTTHWFKIQITIPQNLLKEERLEFQWDTDGEGMVWTEDGNALQGLTGGGERTLWIIPDAFRDGKEHTFFIEMACNKILGNSRNDDMVLPPDEDRMFELKVARILAVNLAARGLYFDYALICDAAHDLPEDTKSAHDATQTCNRIMDAFIAGNGSQESILEGRKIAAEYIGSNVDSETVYKSDREPVVYGIGHCHIDTCWLWPFDETRRKTARSWSNQCDLMERYPEHRFTCSSAQQYKWLKQDYPNVWNRVKHWIGKGAFQPVGGSWVEHDTNMPSGESLVRQFLYGQRFFESNFGERCKTFWLPDTFGYCAQLPQLCRLAGMSRFFTQKISWNNINKFPHTTFNWVALDGSQVLCHMAPAEAYNSEATLPDMVKCISNHRSMDQDATSLYVFGKGDGGGGPTFEHLEKLRRLRGIADKNELIPRVKMGDSVEDFYDRLQKKALEKKTKFVTWNGELYFELHRGTYTTQAHNKNSNRRAEFMLRELEQLATLASLKDEHYKYPKAQIDEMWENVMLCQFHDCLPGSCIRMCYDDSDAIYEKVFAIGKQCMQETLTALGLAGEYESGLSAINTLPWHRSEIVQISNSGNKPEFALISGSTGVIEAKPLSWKAEPPVSVKETSPGVFILKNEKFTVAIEDGVISSIFDRDGNRGVLAEGGKANQFVVYDDKPLYWQAWDVEVYHLESRQALKSGSAKITVNTPHHVSVVTETQISEKSWARSTISLSAVTDDPSANYIDIETEVEWQEGYKFLKVEFDVDIHNSEASYECQYGVTRRPTHYNTSWDMAKFEVCCHKYADFSEHNYGVSILNNSKFGFATAGNTMRLSLLRSPKAPDATADMGRHKIRYAIFPHTGPLGARTVRAGYNFNNPLVLRPTPVNEAELRSKNAAHSYSGGIFAAKSWRVA
ncbi:hypothetical protein KEM56_007758 [Ascosphaera pollenicola]|nr:hypothetical protein KEM56_007758 [Ascosphaera pollenicola]